MCKKSLGRCYPDHAAKMSGAIADNPRSARRLEPPSAIADIAGFAAPLIPLHSPREEPLMQAKQRVPGPLSPETPLMQKKKTVTNVVVPAAGSAPLMCDAEGSAIFNEPPTKLFDSKASRCRQRDTLRHDMQGETTPRYIAHAAATAAAAAVVRAASASADRPAGKMTTDEFIPKKRPAAFGPLSNLSGSGLVG